MRPSAPTRLLIGVCLLWVTGRVMGLSLGTMAPAASIGMVAQPAPTSVAPRRFTAAMPPPDSGAMRIAWADRVDLVAASSPHPVSAPANMAQPSPVALTSLSAPPPVPSSASGSTAIANAHLRLLQRLTAPRPTYGLTQRWQWRETGLVATSYAAIVRPAADRWTLSVWGVGRDGRAPSTGVAPASLGGSQIGARLAYRVDRAGRWEAFARATSAGRLGEGAEGALGLSWQPIAAVPARLSIERRQRLAGDDGRDSFAAYVSGGVSQWPVAAGWRIDGYGAAGVVGVSDGLPFAEAQIAATRAIIRRGRVTVSGGGGIWAAAQSDVARVDVGPRLSIDAGAGVPRVALDWRQRVAGNAAPSSGPALTVGMDF